MCKTRGLSCQTRAAELAAADRGAEANALLLGVLRTLDDDPPGAAVTIQGQNAS